MHQQQLLQQQRQALRAGPGVCSRSRMQRAPAPPQALLGGLKLPALPALFGGGRAGGGDKASKRAEKKVELLELIAPLRRGLDADADARAAVEAAAAALEALNPTPKPLEAPALNGRWRLVYTTSDSILGTKKPAFLRPSGPIYQYIDAPSLRAANRETAPLYNAVTAELTPLSVNKVGVQFKKFKVFGLIPVTAPDSARGELAITYLDDELRVSRGDKGNLFVLVMDAPGEKPPQF